MEQKLNNEELARMLCTYGKLQLANRFIATGDYEPFEAIPLSKISDEDAKYIAKNILGYSEGYHDYFVETGKRYLTKNNNYLDTDIEVIDYLRSRGYDVGYGNIKSLIKSGYALDKTTLNG
jgi:hypothetical protein